MKPSTSKELPFTGERFTCDSSLLDSQIYYEHLHRYLLAAELVAGKNVLDIASGEGYGSDLLSKRAGAVVGIDSAKDAVSHATQKYRRKNLSFAVGRCESIPLESGSVDVVVSFETLEHISAHKKFLSEIKRVMRPSGLLIISTPEREQYGLRGAERNVFHKKELSDTEFQSLLRSAFKNAAFLQQKLIGGSYIGNAILTPNVTSAYGVFHGSFADGQFIPGVPDGLYMIAICSDVEIPELHLGVFEDPAVSKRIWNSFETLPQVRKEKDRMLSQLDVIQAELTAAGEKLKHNDLAETKNADARKRLELEAKELHAEIKKRGEWGLSLSEELDTLKERVRVKENQHAQEKLDWRSAERQLQEELSLLRAASRGWNEALQAEQARSEKNSTKLVLAHETERQQLLARCQATEVECMKRQELLDLSNVSAVSLRIDSEKKQTAILTLTERLSLVEREKEQAIDAARHEIQKAEKKLEMITSENKENLARLEAELDLARLNYIESLRVDRKAAENHLSNIALSQDRMQRIWRDKVQSLEVDIATLSERAEEGEIAVARLRDETNRKHESILDLTDRLLASERSKSETVAEASEIKTTGLRAMEAQRSSHKASLDMMETQLAEAQRQYEVSLKRSRELAQHVASLDLELKRVCLVAASVQMSADELKQVKGSWSWRLTAPLRRVHQAFGDPLSRNSR